MDLSIDPRDLNSLVNVILPLELLNQEGFPSELSFDRMHDLIRTHVATSSTITPEFLFALSTTLSTEAPSETPTSVILPRILNRLTSWRLLESAEKRRTDVVEKLALDLAGLVNGRPSVYDGLNADSKRLRIRWMGKTHDHIESIHQQPVMGDSLDNPPINTAQPSAQASRTRENFCSNANSSFRNGCSCCRQPRDFLTRDPGLGLVKARTRQISSQPAHPSLPLGHPAPLTSQEDIYSLAVSPDPLDNMIPIIPLATKSITKGNDNTVPYISSTKLRVQTDVSRNRKLARTSSAPRLRVDRSTQTTSHRSYVIPQADTQLSQSSSSSGASSARLRSQSSSSAVKKPAFGSSMFSTNANTSILSSMARNQTHSSAKRYQSFSKSKATKLSSENITK